MTTQQPFGVGLVLLAGLLGRPLAADDAATWDGKIVQYGKMHDAIGKQQHEGRVQFQKLLTQDRFFGVAALEKLEGEATIYDGKVTITRVDAEGRLESTESAAPDGQATLLVGAYVPSWTEHKVGRSVATDEFDEYVLDAASKAGINVSAPFVFVVEGEFSNLRLHVINGACPLHARLRKIELPKEHQPFEVERDTVKGKLVGVFAKDSVGNITHPATSTHMHLLFNDEKSGNTATGHVEQIGLREGAILRLPKAK
jgi:alpha-acetolactate decarboxylase